MEDTRDTRGQLDDTADEFDRMVVTPRREGEASLRLRLSLSQEVQEEGQEGQEELQEEEEEQPPPEEPRPPSPMSMAGGDTLLEPPGGLNLDGAPLSTTLDSTARSRGPIDNSVAGAVRAWAPNTTLRNI